MQSRTILILCLLIYAGRLQAQSSDSLASKKFRCTAPSFTDLVSNDLVTKTSIFVIDGPSETIEWQQKNGALTYQFQISSVSDQWRTSADGRLLFNVLWNGNSGTLEVIKTNGIITLVMDVNPSGKDRLYFRFEVSSLDII